MSSTFQFILLILAMIIALLLSRRFALMKMRRAYQFIIDDFRQKNALSPETAVEVPYARRQIIKFGLRDYRPKVLTQMMGMSIIGVVEGQKMYLDESVLAELNTPKDEEETD